MAKVIKFSFGDDGIAETVRAFKRLPKDVRVEADEEFRSIARFVAAATSSAASTPAERKVADTIKAQKASVSLGGGGARSRAGGMALGTEFGGRGRRTTQQFRPHLGTVGYFFWPTIRGNSGRIRKMLDDVMEHAAEGWVRGG